MAEKKELRVINHNTATLTEALNISLEDMNAFQEYIVKKFLSELAKTKIIEDIYQRMSISDDFLLAALCYLIQLQENHMKRIANANPA